MKPCLNSHWKACCRADGVVVRKQSIKAMSSTVLMCLNLLARTMRCFSTYIIQPVQALSPHDAGPAIAVGLYGGLFPIPGTTFFATVILVYITPKMFSTTMKGLSFAVNAITFPLEIILLPHFIQIGSSFFDDLECEPEQLIAKFYDKDAYLIHNIQG